MGLATERLLGDKRIRADGAGVNLVGHQMTEFHRVNVRIDAVRVEAAPEDAPAVGREERPPIVAGRERQAFLARSVGVHDVNLAEVGGVVLETFAVFGRKRLGRISVAQRGEDNFLPVGRIRRFSVVAVCAGQAAQPTAVAFGDENVKVFVVVP